MTEELNIRDTNQVISHMVLEYGLAIRESFGFQLHTISHTLK